jgi:2-hydroxy-3-keto-5-methylthiopentenyl-1-phosphate phosphatase
MHSAFVSDFDGTITQTDFYLLIAERYMEGDPMAIWDRYRGGEMSHFDAMQLFFSFTPHAESELESLLRDITPDPRLVESSRRLKENGWDLIIVSAGSSWYIDRILDRHGVDAVVHANPGRIIPGKGLVLTKPTESQFFSADVGIDKPAVVRDALSRYETVAFAGDGPPDVEPSLLVPADVRYARGFLAQELLRLGEAFRTYESWSAIVDELTGG